MLSCKLYIVHTRIIADIKGDASDLLMNAPIKLLVMMSLMYMCTCTYVQAWNFGRVLSCIWTFV